MATSNVKAVFSCDIQKVWDVVTSLSNHWWRSDLSKVKILSEKEFIEYTKDGYPTKFTVTCTEICKRWEFDMENSNMKGHWTGVFNKKGDCTEIDFTEEVTAKKIIMRPFVKDLKKALEELR